MKQVKNRQKIDKLYVLGAGASHSLTYVNPKKRKFVRSIAPLDKDFLKALQQNQNSGWQKIATDLIYANWLDRDELNDQGLEQAIIKRVSQYEFLANLDPSRVRQKQSNEEYLNNLSHLITDYLYKCKSNSSGDTKNFINEIFPTGIKPNEYNNRVITFNYDTLIERPLIERGISKKKIYFDRIVKNKEDGTKRKSSEIFLHPLILKLHGSINWRCDRSHFDQIISGNIDQQEKVIVWSSDHKVPKPNDDESPLIIPPIPNKPITQTSLFKFLWTTAYEYLHEAKKLVIVGYSCPPTDTLARTMFTHFSGKNLKEISIVDPNAIALKNYREMFDLKLSSRIKWHYYSNFHEYIEQELIN